ncbi:MAG: hypothetical protein ACJAW3_001511 [Lentimonas sp.]|jgi:hypothetical protein
MSEKVQNITNNISLVLHNINLAKSELLERQSMEYYDSCNDLRVNFKNFYQETLEKICHVEDEENGNLNHILELFNKIKSSLKLFANYDNKILLKDIEDSVDQIKDLADSLFYKQKETPLDKESILMIQNQIMCFKYDNDY